MITGVAFGLLISMNFSSPKMYDYFQERRSLRTKSILHKLDYNNKLRHEVVDLLDSAVHFKYYIQPILDDTTSFTFGGSEGGGMMDDSELLPE
ncbi:MAG: hypothetical protein AAFX87_10585 [Bacteroidota bacterium]